MYHLENLVKNKIHTIAEISVEVEDITSKQVMKTSANCGLEAKVAVLSADNTNTNFRSLIKRIR
jgi:hypothetical protein